LGSWWKINRGLSWYLILNPREQPISTFISSSLYTKRRFWRFGFLNCPQRIRCILMIITNVMHWIGVSKYISSADSIKLSPNWEGLRSGIMIPWSFSKNRFWPYTFDIVQPRYQWSCLGIFRIKSFCFSIEWLIQHFFKIPLHV
jgi:hypothetical protein